MTDILAVCIESVRETGNFLLDNFENNIIKIDKKPDKSLVTNLDREAEKMISDRIKGAFPGHGILGEEGGFSGPGDEYIWIIDPLDGTHNYIRGIGLFGVSVGVSHHGNFTAGAVYMPVSNELYYAEIHNGAYKNGNRIHISGKNSLNECTVVFDSDLKEDSVIKLDILRDLSPQVFNIRMLGTSVRHLTYLAEGKVDAVIEFNDKPWDFAGSAVIIREAGGKITSFNGIDLTYRDNGFIASNGLVHNKLKEITDRKSI